MTDWEKAYYNLKREHQCLRRIGVRDGHRLLRLWHRSDFWPDRIAAIIEPIITRITCVVHNHTPFTEMDNRTIVCAVCAKRLGEHHV